MNMLREHCFDIHSEGHTGAGDHVILPKDNVADGAAS